LQKAYSRCSIQYCKPICHRYRFPQMCQSLLNSPSIRKRLPKGMYLKWATGSWKSGSSCDFMHLRSPGSLIYSQFLQHRGEKKGPTLCRAWPPSLLSSSSRMMVGPGGNFRFSHSQCYRNRHCPVIHGAKHDQHEINYLLAKISTYMYSQPPSKKHVVYESFDYRQPPNGS
jgi:hypothetical protein